MLRLLLSAAAVLAVSASLAAPGAAQPVPAATDFRARPARDEVIYFVLPDRFENGDKTNDRGGLKGSRLQTGFDPANKGFYHGGDLKGLAARLDYIQGLGATALWVGPIFRNKPVQGPPGQESAGYHGYWITDFTQVDPHFGTNAEFRSLVDAAHARGMKVYMDIVVNHTADVIHYAEVPSGSAPYRGRADFPFSRKGGPTGPAINPGFGGDADPAPANWDKLRDPSFAYTPVVDPAEAKVKVPAWLNDPKFYHNRGDSNWQGESAQYGDFSGLDDLATEDPRVVAGFIDIFGKWIDDFGVDGFRIDTAKHVNPEFWRAFVPAMLKRAADRGIPNFHIFGEVATSGYDPALLAGWTRNAGLPAVLDFGFQHAVAAALAGQGNGELARLFDDDVLYAGGPDAVLQLPTFVSNHDAGRLPMMIRQAMPKIDTAELLARQRLGHAMLLTLRGVPVIYYGDEQGMIGGGGDQLSRQDMFPSQVALYNAEPLLGTAATTAASNFDPAHPLYREWAALAALRRGTPALTAGRTVVRAGTDKPGLFAVSRFDPQTGREVVLAFNTSTQPITAAVQVEVASRSFVSLAGACPAEAAAPGTLTLTLPPLGYAICGPRGE
ncbi:alpha-amylase family glycosyl hydrolase [Novosphingobium aerophilum]|uniref:Alpha-amylase n=1 Tax=Novosphingobium aerophilum TaxID=2839843 RepID=A0A7X1KC95_9SPHN|nr:alpha-amylase family glycosyl hydrolase [Novosphingobium aerophilum]MBC2652010.1 alpha-amylase [Novosphingobium aerophilum]